MWLYDHLQMNKQQFKLPSSKVKHISAGLFVVSVTAIAMLPPSNTKAIVHQHSGMRTSTSTHSESMGRYSPTYIYKRKTIREMSEICKLIARRRMPDVRKWMAVRKVPRDTKWLTINIQSRIGRGFIVAILSSVCTTLAEELFPPILLKTDVGKYS